MQWKRRMVRVAGIDLTQALRDRSASVPRARWLVRAGTASAFSNNMLVVATATPLVAEWAQPARLPKYVGAIASVAVEVLRRDSRSRSNEDDVSVSVDVIVCFR